MGGWLLALCAGGGFDLFGYFASRPFLPSPANVTLSPAHTKTTNNTNHTPNPVNQQENMFVFGVDAADVPRLRKERKAFKTDPRFDEIMADVAGGMFGDADYFKPLVDSISNMKVRGV
jgi:hypothetical protein